MTQCRTICKVQMTKGWLFGCARVWPGSVGNKGGQIRWRPTWGRGGCVPEGLKFFYYSGHLGGGEGRVTAEALKGALKENMYFIWGHLLELQNTVQVPVVATTISTIVGCQLVVLVAALQVQLLLLSGCHCASAWLWSWDDGQDIRDGCGCGCA